MNQYQPYAYDYNDERLGIGRPGFGRPGFGRPGCRPGAGFFPFRF